MTGAHINKHIIRDVWETFCFSRSSWLHSRAHHPRVGGGPEATLSNTQKGLRLVSYNSQHWHGAPFSYHPFLQVILVALPGLTPQAVEAELKKQLAELPRLKAVTSAFHHSAIVQAKDRAEAVAFSNA